MTSGTVLVRKVILIALMQSSVYPISSFAIRDFQSLSQPVIG